MLWVIATHSQGDVRRDDYVSPIASHKTACPILFLAAGSIAGESAIRLGVFAEALLEGKTIQSPLLVVVIMDDGSAWHEQHVEIPINQVRSIVVTFSIERAQLLVSQFIHLEGDLHCIY